MSLLNRLLRALLNEHIGAPIRRSIAEDDRIGRQLQPVGRPKLAHLGDPRRGELHLLGALLLQRAQQLRRRHRSLGNLDALLAGGSGRSRLLLGKGGDALLLTGGRYAGADLLNLDLLAGLAGGGSGQRELLLNVRTKQQRLPSLARWNRWQRVRRPTEITRPRRPDDLLAWPGRGQHLWRSLEGLRRDQLNLLLATDSRMHQQLATAVQLLQILVLDGLLEHLDTAMLPIGRRQLTGHGLLLLLLGLGLLSGGGHSLLLLLIDSTSTTGIGLLRLGWVVLLFDLDRSGSGGERLLELLKLLELLELLLGQLQGHLRLLGHLLLPGRALGLLQRGGRCGRVVLFVKGDAGLLGERFQALERSFAAGCGRRSGSVCGRCSVAARTHRRERSDRAQVGNGRRASAAGVRGKSRWGRRGCGRRLSTGLDESGTALLGFRLGWTPQQFDLHHVLLLLLLLLLNIRIGGLLQRSLQMQGTLARMVVLLMLLLLGTRVQRRMVVVVVVVELLLLLLLQIIVMLRPLAWRPGVKVRL